MREWRALVRRTLTDAGIEADEGLLDELVQHVEDRYTERLRHGDTEEEACAAALAELDGVERLSAARPSRRPRPPAAPIGGPPLAGRLGACWLDLRYACRTLRRTPAFTVATILTVAISATPAIAVLSIGNWLFVRPIAGVIDPDRLATVSFGTRNDAGYTTAGFVSAEHVARIAAMAPGVEGAAGWLIHTVSVSAGDREPRLVNAESVSWNYFDLLGIRMRAGRSFVADEDRPGGGAPVALASDRIARSLFPEAPVIGGQVAINGVAATVVGVVPDAFAGSVPLRRVDVWMPGYASPRFSHRPDWTYASDDGPFYQYVVRMRHGISGERAAAELHAAGRALAAGDPSAAKFERVEPLFASGFGSVPASWKLGASALFGLTLLLVAAGAANLANLFGFRSLRRAHDVALRRALGASAFRLMQFQAVESMLVALAGGAAGLLLVGVVQWTVGGMPIAPEAELPTLSVDLRLAAATMVLTVVAGVFMAIVPARLAMRQGLAVAVGSGGASTVRAASRLRRGLAVAQLAVSLTLLVGALLFVATLRQLWAVDAGIDPHGLSTYEFAFHTGAYSPERKTAFFEALLSNISGWPGVTAVAIGSSAPMMGGATVDRIQVPEPGAVESSGEPPVDTLLEGFAGLAPEGAILVQRTDVSAGYFEALGIEIVAGRAFLPQDMSGGEAGAAVVVSESLARRLFGSTNAVGRTLTRPGGPNRLAADFRVVGVARDVRWRDLATSSPFLVYFPLDSLANGESVLVRSTAPVGEVTAAVREQARMLDPALPVTTMPMEQAMALRLLGQRLFAWVLGTLAALGFLLATVGVYGLVAQSVVERTREFGIRLALGADRRDVLRLVLRSMLVIAGTGVMLGVALGAALAQLLRSRLYGVTPGEPWPYVIAALALLGVVLAASVVPALRAARTPPADVLRAE